MIKGRRVGTLTAGITFVVVGVVFLLQSMFGIITYKMIIKFWPLILILLGIEILLSYIINREEKIRFDGGAIALTIIITLFAFFLGYFQYAVEYYPQFSRLIS